VRGQSIRNILSVLLPLVGMGFSAGVATAQEGENVCQTGYQRLLACFEEHCGENRADPGCANADEYLAWARAEAAREYRECPPEVEATMRIVVELECSDPSARGLGLAYVSNARTLEAQAGVNQLQGLVQLFQVMHDRLPGALDELSQPLDGLGYVTEQVPGDPWGHPWEYLPRDDGTFALFSCGPDGMSGTDDDIHPDGTGGWGLRAPSRGTPTADDDVCERAQAHMVQCMVEYCESAPEGDPICAMLSRPLPDVPECFPDVAEAARSLLAMSCADLFGGPR
jgi:hypothetical protein